MLLWYIDLGFMDQEITLHLLKEDKRSVWKNIQRTEIIGILRENDVILKIPARKDELEFGYIKILCKFGIGLILKYQVSNALL